MDAEETDFNDVEDFVFKEKENVSIGTGFGSVESAIGNLILVSNKYGFVIAAIKKGLRFIRSQNLHKKSSDHGSTVQIPLEDNATSIGLAADQLTLSVVITNSTKVLLYDIPKIAGRDVASFASPDFNSEVEDLRWHATDPNTFAVKLADGRVIEYNVSTGSQTSVATLRDVMSISWHPSQNTIACLLEDGKIEIYTKNGDSYSASRSLPALEADGNDSADASYIRWFDDNVIGVGYSLSETDVAFLMITLKGDDYEAQKMIAQTDMENPSFSTAYIKEWKALLWVTTGAQDIEVMSQDDDGKWFTAILMDDARPNVPMENFILGMGFDYTNTVQLKKGEDTFYPVSPLLVFVTHEGRLCTFDFVNKAYNNAAPFMVSNVPALPAPKQRGSVTSNVNSGAPIASPNTATTSANNNAATQTPTPGAPKTGSTGSFGFGDTVSSLSFTSGTSTNSFGFGTTTPSAPTNQQSTFGISTPAGSSTAGTSATPSNPGSFNFGFGTPTQFDKPTATPAAPKTGLSSSGSNTFSFGPSTTADAGKKDDKKDANPFGFGSTSFGFSDTTPKPTDNKPPTTDAPKLGSSGSAFSFGLSNPEPSSVSSPSVQRRAQAAPPKQAPATDFGFGSGATSFTFDTKPKAPSTATAPTTAAPPKTSSQQAISFAPAPKQSPQQAPPTQAQPAPIKINLSTPSSQVPPGSQGTPSIGQNVPSTKPPQAAQPPQPQPVQGQQAAKPKQGVTAQELISRPINPERGIEQQFMEQIAIFNEAMRRAHGWVADTVNKIKAIQQGAKMPPEKKLPFTEAELTQLCASTSDIMAKVDGDNVEIEALKRQVDALKINFLDAFAFAQEAESLIMASQDESYQHLLDSRNLDPESQETRKKLKRLINEVDSSVKQVEQYLDSMMIKRGKRDDKAFKVPTLASLYGTLRSHYEIVANQKQKIKQLSDAFNRIQLRLAAEGRPVPSAAWDDLKKVQSAQKVKKISRTLQSKPQFSYNPTSVMAAPTENIDFDPEMPYYYYNKQPSGSRMRELKQILKQRFVSTGRSKPNTNVVNIPEDLLELKLTPSTPVQSYRQPSSLTSTPSSQISSVTPKMTPTAGVSPMSTNLLNQPKPAMMSSPFAAAPAPSAAPSTGPQWSAAPSKVAAVPMQFGFPTTAPTKQPAARVIDDDEGSIDEELSTAEMLKKMQQKPTAPNANNNQTTSDNKDFLAGQKFGVPNLTNSALIKPTPSPAKSLSASGTQFTTGRIKFGVAEDQDGDEEEEWEEDEEYDEEYDDEEGTPEEEYEEPEQAKPSPVKPRPQVPVAAAKTSGNSLNGSGSFGFGTTGSSFSFGQPSTGSSNTNKPAQSTTAAPFTSGSTSNSASAFNFNAGATKGPAPAAMTGPKPGEKRKTGAPQTLVSYHDPEEEDEEEEEGEDSEDSYVETTGPRPGAVPPSGAAKVSPKPADQAKPLGTSGSFSFGTADSTKPGTSSFGFGTPSTTTSDANKPAATAAPSTSSSTSGSSSLGFGSLSSLGANTFSFGGPTGGDKKPGDTKPATGTSSTFSFGSLGATDATKPATGTSTSDAKTSPGTKPATSAPSTDKPAGTTLGSSFTFGGPSTTTSGDKPPTSGSSTFTFGSTTSSAPTTDTKPAATTTPATGSSTFSFGTTPSTDASKPTTTGTATTTPATSTPATSTGTATTAATGTTATTAPSTTATTTGTGFGFGSSSGTSGTFGFGSGSSSTFGLGSTPATTTTGTTSTFGTPAATTTPAKPDAAKPTEPTTPATPASGFGFGFGSSTPSFGFGAQPSTPSTPSTFGATQPSATTAPGGTSTGGLSFGLSLGGPTAQPNKPATNPFGGATTTPAATTAPSTGNLFGGTTSGSFLTQPTFGSSFGSTPSTPAAQPSAPTTSFGTPAPSSGSSPFASFGQQSSLGSVFGQSSSLGGPTASFGSTSTFGSPATPGFGLGNPQAVQQQIQATTNAPRVFGSGSTFGSPSTGGSPFSQLASSSPGFGGGQPTTGFGGFGGAPQPAAQPPQFGNSAMWAPRK